MTKKFFNDWFNKRHLTTRIKLQNDSNGKKYRVYNHQLILNTLDFEGEYISIVSNIDWYYALGCKEKQMRIKIHRKDINTVYFK